MGLTIGDVANGFTEDVWGKMRVRMRDITFDDSYPTGGEAVSPSAFGLKAILGLVLVGVDSDAAPYHVVWDYVNKKLKVYISGAHSHDLLLKNAAVADGAAARVNAGANLLGANTGGDLTVAGGGANGGVQNSTAAVLAEVAALTNLSTLTVRVLAFGY